MDSIHICGEKRLQGELTVQGSKNAALPILAACVLIEGISVIKNCPDISDVRCMIKLLESIGCCIRRDGKTVIVDARNISDYRLPSEYVTLMRSSVILMGALLGRMKNAFLDYPGGCVIGKRPIDLHMAGFRQMGVLTKENETSIQGETTCLKGSNICLEFPSVGATENVVLAAVLALGTTRITNYAKEPEIKALCDFLNAAGANIRGFGKNVLCITGCHHLRPTIFEVPADRIVAGTYLLACQAAGGEIVLRNTPIDTMQYLAGFLGQMGSKITIMGNDIFMSNWQRSRNKAYTKTEVYPGFPTDLQSPLMVALALAEGESVIEETIFENRFKAAKELNLMGANISIQGNRAVIKGVTKLYGKQVMAEELRGGAALVLAGLCAKGVTIVNNRHFIDRGYEDIGKDLQCLGADIT